MSDDCISRQEAIDAINEYGSVWMEYTDSMTVDEIADRALKASKQSMHKIIHDLPSVTPKPKTGHWILTDDDFVYCSECENSYYPRPIDASWYYCPNCGAKMEVSE